MDADLRAKIEEAIERLLALLDADDGDEDLEEGGDLELALAWPEQGPDVVLPFGDDDREHDDADLEPSLAAPEQPPLGMWVQEWRGEFNAVHHTGDQTYWAKGSDSDREHDEEREEDPGEWGVADHGGLAEQMGGAN